MIEGTRLVGAHFRSPEEKEVVKTLSRGDILQLIREPDNSYDENAIKVMKDDIHLGYIPKDLAAVIASKLDQYPDKKWTAEVTLVTSDLKPWLEIDLG